jgi:uncharacterized protein with NRDE domain
MCLLVIASRLRPDLPLIVGANRDELLTRPASPMDVLRLESPRVIGGRDLLEGGTWLAVNEYGVVAGITNRPSRGGRDPAKRSRGELPLALASHPSATGAVAAFVDSFRPSDYNPGWLAVADRHDLFTIDMTGDHHPEVVKHEAGLHIFENCPPGTDSPKVGHVRSLLARLAQLPEPDALLCLKRALADHDPPAGPTKADQPDRQDPPTMIPTACLHADRFGTRWSALITVGKTASFPVFQYANGPPCNTPFLDGASYWQKWPTSREQRRADRWRR